MQVTEKPELTDTGQKRFFSALLIDDDTNILAIFKRSLAHAGIHTFAFTNCVLAVEHFRRNANSYDIVVIGNIMCDMSKFQVAREVKQIRLDVKVAFATSVDINKPEFDNIFPSTEVDAFITKPVKQSSSMYTDVFSVLQQIPYKGGVIKFEN
jgi:DNA-binding NtrC family response regulator